MAADDLLAGFVVCAVCSTPMSAGGGDRASYRCSTARGGCGSVSIAGAQLDELVAALVLDRLARVKIQRSVKHSVEDAEIDRLSAVIAELQTAFDSSELDVADYVSATRSARARLTEVTKRRTLQVVAASGPGHVDAEQWARLPLSRRRAILSRSLTAVVVAKAAARGIRFDRGRVRIVWRARR